MRMTFDPDADAAYIYVKDQLAFGEVKETHICDVQAQEGAIILGFDKAGHLVGVEILGAGKFLHPDVLAAAERPSGQSPP
jgi:uncharacterized protein YuzE